MNEGGVSPRKELEREKSIYTSFDISLLFCAFPKKLVKPFHLQIVPHRICTESYMRISP